MPATAQQLTREDRHYRIRFADGTEVSARTVVLATGARYRKLPVPRLEESLEAVVVQDNESGEQRTLPARELSSSAQLPVPTGWTARWPSTPAVMC